MLSLLTFSFFMTPKKLEQKNQEKRPPIVAIMGHVDHGKTTLLDYIRSTNVAGREAGGITQSVGAYEIEHAGNKITFIDTPGHEAFAKMRARGAKVADLAILIVAADDWVKPQTKNALSYIEKEKVPFVVAINKIDKNNADVEGTINDLMQAGVYLEGRGGNVSWHQISAKTGEGINELLDLILLASEMEDIHCSGDNVSSGIVVSVKLDSKRGICTSVVIKNGSLEQGAMIATHTASGKVKILEDFLGKSVKSLTPSAPAMIIGFEKPPKVGEVFCSHKDSVALQKALKTFDEEKVESMNSDANDGTERISIFIKADELGSLEALSDVLRGMQENLPVSIIKSGIGSITENDMKDAESMKAIIVGFRTKIDKAAENFAQARGVRVISSDIIYKLIESLEEYAGGAIEKEKRALEVLGVFGAAKGKERVIGGKVLCGPVRGNEAFEVWHNNKKIGEGRILNLQSNRKDIMEAEKDMEVGMLVECAEDIRVGNKLVFSD